jgi:hypothetical protein
VDVLAGGDLDHCLFNVVLQLADDLGQAEGSERVPGDKPYLCPGTLPRSVWDHVLSPKGFKLP